jgi:hypothetical protein
MAFAVGAAVMAQAKSTSRGPRSGVIEAVLRGDPAPRYRIRWDDGHESTVTPSSGTLQAQPHRARPKLNANAKATAKTKAKAKAR